MTAAIESAIAVSTLPMKKHSSPSDADIDAAMKNVLCRCGTYQRIRKAIHSAATLKRVKREPADAS